MTDPLAFSEELTRADARLQATIAALSEASVGEPSLLPGWTRGHVLTHIARNADAFVNLLTWARTGVETPGYAHATARADGIEAGAKRPLVDHIEDIRASAARVAEGIAAMPPEAWSAVLGPQQGSASRLVWRRLREVEIHHVDLGAGYAPSDWPEAFSQRLLRELVTDRTTSAGSGPAIAVDADELTHPLQIGSGSPAVTVSGPAHELAAWLSGRSSGAALTVSPSAPLPDLADWM